MVPSQEVDTKRVEIFLPYGLRTRVASQDGTTNFQFEPAISAAFHHQFLIDYFDSCLHYHRTLFGRRGDKQSPREMLINSGLEIAIRGMLRQTLPDFFGEEQFYGKGLVDLDQKDFDSGSSSPDMWLYHKIDERNSDSFVNIWFQSPENLKPVVKNERVANPSISGGYMRGYVNLFPRISDPSKGSYATFDERESYPILKAFLTGENISLLEQIPRGIPKVFSCGYAHVERPTLERMKAAIGYASQISDFFRENDPRLQEVALHIKEARAKYVCQMDRLRQAYQNLISTHGLAEKIVGQKLPKPAGIDDTLAAVELSMQKSLQPVNEEIKAMSRDFPKGLIAYVPQEQLQLFESKKFM